MSLELLASLAKRSRLDVTQPLFVDNERDTQAPRAVVVEVGARGDSDLRHGTADPIGRGVPGLGKLLKRLQSRQNLVGKGGAGEVAT